MPSIARRTFALTVCAFALAGIARPAAAAGDTFFSAVDIRSLVLRTPGVTRDAGHSLGDSIYVDVVGQRGGFVHPERVSGGKTIDGDWLLAVPLDSGGAGGAYTALVYHSTGGAPEYVAVVNAKRGGLDVSVHDGHLFVTAPVWRKGDLDCCPSVKVVKRMLYSANADGLIEVSLQKVDLSKPPPAPQPTR
jgi:hypothetical protein